MLAVDLLTRVGLATLLGVAIGLERQWRARMAGLQTMALVSMGSALFLILGAYSFPDADPTRVAAQIVSGIGFLGAGVILKQGVSVIGLNTAATLWATAAVGALAGAWLWREALAGAVIVVVGNLLLHPLAARIDRRKERGATPAAAGYTVEVVCRTSVAEQTRELLTTALRNAGLVLTSLGSTRLPATDEVLLRTDVTATADAQAGVQSALTAVSSEPLVSATRWSTSSPSPV